MKFILGALALDIATKADYPSAYPVEIVQAKERSASGVLHVENFLHSINRITFNYSELTTTEYEQLVNWFVDVANASMNTFHVIDDLGKSYDARFSEGTLDFKITGYGVPSSTGIATGLWAGSFTLEKA